MEQIEKTHKTSVTPSLVVKDSAQAIEFYKKAFGAEEIFRMPGPDGKGIMHAEIKIGDSTIFLGDEHPGCVTKSPESLGGAVTSTFYISVPDVDSTYKQALEAGAKEEMAIEDMFWGDRMGTVIDPFGHHWGIATHVKDVTPEELRAGAEEFLKRMAEEKEKPVEASV